VSPRVDAIVEALRLAEAAARLGVSPRQVRYAIERGAPVVKRGRKGHGHATLVDPEALRRWLRKPDRMEEARNHELANNLIRAVADNAVLQFRMQSGPHKLALAANVVESFSATANAICTQLGLSPPEPNEVPENIRQIAKLLSI
jgi:hypothetical protein